MDEAVDKEYCRKCGMEVYPFSKKYSVSSGDYFCIRCAEKADSEYLIRHSCSVCKRLLNPDEVKLVMPSKIYGEGVLPLADRLICTRCFQQIGDKSVDRRTFRQKVGQIRGRIRKGMMKKTFEKQATSRPSI